MNLIETAKICSAIRGMVPNQRFEDDTPEFWQVPLADIPYLDAREAILRVIKRQQYIGVNDILTEVAAIRRARIQTAEDADGLVPNVDPDNPRAFIAERRAIMAAAADGSLDVDAYAAGGFTLTGAPPRRAIGPAGDPANVARAITSGVRFPRPSKPRAAELTTNRS
jgi:hypothetical protein